LKRAGLLLLVVGVWGCATAPKPQTTPQTMHGVASWYGQEFAGRTTANGEIFDPMLFTAAHRTLPFGTVVDVKNAVTDKTVRVRINDRGPYIGGRVIDLSYAAAKRIGLIEPGSGEVEISLVKLGGGEREPPAPYVVTIPDVKPLPAAASEPPDNIPVVVDNVRVVTEKQGVETRLQVSSDGHKIEEVPVKPAAEKPKEVLKATPQPAGKFVVQVGAFAQEVNARRLLSQLTQLGQSAYIEPGLLFLVRIGPFATRELAMQARARLENAGLSAIIVTQ
jgi:rare lipoprotein A